ncbi:MAG: NAD kinase [Cellulomonadaceae bacterium]|jgi:NAD+ kinase|nr:NAD kinase [Cellulomonadaceae bacterium]
MKRKVLIVTHGGRPAAVTASNDAVRELTRAGFEVALHNDALVRDFGEEMAAARVREGVASCDVVIVLGGDGSILRATELTHGTGVPILGVNLGHVGFLAELEPGNITEMVKRLDACDYTVEERTVAAVTVHRPGEDEPMTGWGLNEATIEKAERMRMIEVGIEVDDRPLSSFGCDGVVIATSTGSTAHAFSGGGPVMWPNTDALLMVPLAAHALFARPLVIGPQSSFSVTILDTSAVPAVLTCDGRRTIDLPIGSRVDVKISDQPIRFARLFDAAFTDRLVSKFALPIKGWRQTASEAMVASDAPASELPHSDGPASDVPGDPTPVPTSPEAG